MDITGSTSGLAWGKELTRIFASFMISGNFGHFHFLHCPFHSVFLHENQSGHANSLNEYGKVSHIFPSQNHVFAYFSLNEPTTANEHYFYSAPHNVTTPKYYLNHYQRNQFLMGMGRQRFPSSSSTASNGSSNGTRLVKFKYHMDM
jgi:hypothetical protein